MNYIDKIKQDFPFFRENPSITFLDNAGTSLKPQKVLDSMNRYYTHYSVNSHNTDSNLGYLTELFMEDTRKAIAKFINAPSYKEVIFNSGTTHGINFLANGLEEQLNNGEEIILNKVEHISNLLPWMVLAQKKDLKINYVNFQEKTKYIDTQHLEQILSPKTKIFTIALGSNTIGYIQNIKEICSVIKNYNKDILVFVDCAQTIAHIPTDVQDWGVDAVYASFHKMYGPTGIGFIWCKEFLLNKLKPLLYGGGVVTSINEENNSFELKKWPECFEAGTPNLGAIFGVKAAIEYVEEWGLKKINSHEVELKNYFIKQAQSQFPNKIKIYNAESELPLVLFNIIDVFAQDVVSHLGSQNNIILRAGDSCAKLLPKLMPCDYFVRVSFAIYNTKEDVDKLVNALKFEKDFLGSIF